MIHDIQDQVVEPLRISFAEEGQLTGNHAGSKRAEKAAIGKLRNEPTFLLPVANIVRLADRCRALGVMVIHVRFFVTEGARGPTPERAAV